MQSRHLSILKERNLIASIPAKIADVIESSNYISSKYRANLTLRLASKERSNLLLNRAKRFQWQKKESAIINESEKDRLTITALQNEIANLDKELKYQHIENKDADKNRIILKKLLNSKLIDSEGNLI